jgi:hypothetical protein
MGVLQIPCDLLNRKPLPLHDKTSVPVDSILPQNSRSGWSGFTRAGQGIIAGNAHTPRYVAWPGRLIPGPFGAIDQDDIARAFVAEFVSSSAPNGVVYLENGAMRQRSRALK